MKTSESATGTAGWLAEAGRFATSLLSRKDRSLRALGQSMSDLCASASGKPLVANTGLLKAGKSTLFNALTDERAGFGVASVRCTTAFQQFDAGNYMLGDTPGIDYSDSDTAEAERVLHTADLVLFCHPLSQGEYVAEEIAFLRRVREFLPSEEERRRRIVAVFTKAEKVDGADLDAIQAKAFGLLRDHLGAEPEATFTVASERYLRGLREGRSRLQESSGVPALRRHLQERGASLGASRAALARSRVEDCLRRADSELAARATILRGLSRLRQDNAVVEQHRLKKLAEQLFASLESRLSQVP